MSEPSNEEYLKLAVDEPLLGEHVRQAIRSLVARLEAAEKKAAGLMTVASNDANDIVQLGLAMEEVQHKLVRAEAALAERDEAIGAALAVLPAFRPPGTDLHRLVNLARGMLDVGDGPARVADLVKAARKMTAWWALASAPGDAGCNYLNENGWDDGEAAASDLAQALAAFTPPAQEQSDE